MDLDAAGLTGLHWLGVALVAITGVIHLGLGIAFLPAPPGIAFLLAGLSFFGAIALFLVNYRRPLLYLVGIPYVGVQIVLWYAINRPTPASLVAEHQIALVDKVVQVVLIVVLAALYVRES